MNVRAYAMGFIRRSKVLKLSIRLNPGMDANMLPCKYKLLMQIDHDSNLNINL